MSSRERGDNKRLEKNRDAGLKRKTHIHKQGETIDSRRKEENSRGNREDTLIVSKKERRELF